MGKQPPPPLKNRDGSGEPLRPPIETRDGSLVWEAAPDQANWRIVHSADGHPYKHPPETAHIAREGATWHEHEALLRPALVARELASAISTKLRPGRKLGETTEIALEVLGAHLRTHSNYKPPTAKRLEDFATQRGLAGPNKLDPDGVLGVMMRALMRGYNRASTIPRPKSTR
jgi:hypothetical protein